MAKTTINKNQLDPLEIVNADINANAAIETSKLADGAKFIKSDGTVVFTENQSMNNKKLTDLGAPTNPGDAVRLQDLQNTQAGLSSKEAVRAATTANITLSGAQTIDGVALVAGNRVLVKNQTTASANGIYEVAAGAWTRTSDADSSGELKSGTYVFVQEGATQADSGWVLSTDGVITLGTTALVWAQFTGAGQINAGAGLTKNGNTLNVETASVDRIVVNGDNIDLAKVGAGAATTTGIKTTYDAYGRITSSEGLAASDLPAHNHTWAQITDAPATYAPSAHTLGFHSDVTITSVQEGNILRWNGNAWVNSTLVEAGIQPTITNPLTSDKYKVRETPAGAINGANGIFTLASLPVAGKEMVFLNGQLLEPGGDYTISGSTITIIAPVPVAGDLLRVTYFAQ